MSRFETSKFLKSPQTMNQEVLKIACDNLGWKYQINNDELIVINLGKNENLYGEYALKVKGDVVTYNSYYLRNGRELIDNLKKEFYPLNVQYSKQTIIQEFEKKGFTFKRDWDFVATDEIAENFYMVGETKMEGEEQKRFEIKFSILADGTVITDSNYLPDDVNISAHLAMDEIEDLLGNKRIMTKKEIPAEYRGRVRSMTKEIEEIKQKLKTNR